MKKLLAILAAVGLTASVSANVVGWAPQVQTKHFESPSEQNQLNVDILVEDLNGNKLTSFDYQTDFKTLGEVMQNDPKHYQLKDFGGTLGFYLEAITYEKDGETITLPEDPGVTFWGLYYVLNGEEIFSDVGISNFIFAERSTEIIWRFSEVWS